MNGSKFLRCHRTFVRLGLKEFLFKSHKASVQRQTGQQSCATPEPSKKETMRGRIEHSSRPGVHSISFPEAAMPNVTIMVSLSPSVSRPQTQPGCSSPASRALGCSAIPIVAMHFRRTPCPPDRHPLVRIWSLPRWEAGTTDTPDACMLISITIRSSKRD